VEQVNRSLKNKDLEPLSRNTIAKHIRTSKKLTSEQIKEMKASRKQRGDKGKKRKTQEIINTLSELNII
jgi:hypothetical protein